MNIQNIKTSNTERDKVIIVKVMEMFTIICLCTVQHGFIKTRTLNSKGANTS